MNATGVFPVRCGWYNLSDDQAAPAAGKAVEEAAKVTEAALKRCGPLGIAETPEQVFPYFKKGGISCP